MAILPDKPEIKEKTPSKLFTAYYPAMMLLLIAAFVTAAYFVIRPTIFRIKETNAQTDFQLLRLADQRKYLQSLEQSVSAAQSIDQASLAKVSSALPDEGDAPALLMQLSAAAARNGIQIQSVQIGDAKAPPAVPGVKAATTTAAVLPADIALALRAGSYANVKRYLADVEQSLRLMDVAGMTLGSVGEKGDMTYQVQLRTYQFRSAAQISASPPKP